MDYELVKVEQWDSDESQPLYRSVEYPEILNQIEESAQPQPYSCSVINTSSLISSGLLTAFEIQRSMACFIPLLRLRTSSERRPRPSLYRNITRTRRTVLMRRKKRMMEQITDENEFNKDDDDGSSSSLSDHYSADSCSGSKPACDICNKVFSRPSGLRIHRRRVHGIETVDASEPGIRSKKCGNDTPRKYKCQYCDKGLTRRSFLIIHERTHTGEKPFLCSSCGAAFKRQISLKEHIKTVHTECKDLNCKICGDSFSRKMSLRYHMVLKHSENRFKCEFVSCGREFVQKAKLQRHEKIHESSKPHQCKKCNKSYKTIEVMEEHMKSHDERSVRVPKPPRTKKPKPTIDRPPRKTPAPERRLECIYCDKRFPYYNDLARHEKIHLNIRDFKCPNCEKVFVTKYHMWDHMKKAHGYKPEQPLLTLVTCQYCTKQCLGQGRLDLHMKSKHLNQIDSDAYSVPTPTNMNARPADAAGGDHPTSTETNPTNTITNEPTGEVTELSSVIVITDSVVTPEVESNYSSPSPGMQDVIQDVEVTSNTFPMGNENDTHFYTSQPMYNPDHGPGQVYFPSMSSVPQLQLPTITPPQFDYSVRNCFLNTDSSSSNIAPQQFWQVQTASGIEQLQQPESTVDMSVLSEDYSSLTNDYSDMIHVGESLGEDIAFPVGVSQEQESHFTEPTHQAQNRVHVQDESGDKDPEENEPISKKSKRKPRAGAEVREKRIPKSRPRKVYLPCDVCGKEFKTCLQQREHRSAHVPQITCTICGKILLGLHRFKTHSVIHDPTLKPYKCPVEGCNAEFRGSNSVRKHRREVHPEPLDSQTFHTCQVCNEKFWSIKTLATHAKIHTEKKFSCTHPGCNYSVVSMERLRRHEEQHVDKDERLRPYKCFICDKTYLRCENLEQHMDVAHSKVGQGDQNPATTTKFTCPYCPSEHDFAWKLTVHVRRCHDPTKKKRKPRQFFHTCYTCDKSFPYRYDLTRHIKSIHSAEGIALICPSQFCDYIYYAIDKLKSHIESQHDDMTPEEQELFEKMISSVASEQGSLNPEQESESVIDNQKQSSQPRSSRSERLRKMKLRYFDSLNDK